MPDDAPEFFDPAEDREERTPREIFLRFGYAPLMPSELIDRQLPGRLWELLYAAAARRFFFPGDYLNDRQLRTLLWSEWLWLRYYAADDDRSEHMKDWPNDELPPKE